MQRQPARSITSAHGNATFSTGQSFNAPETRTKPINFEQLLEKYLLQLQKGGSTEATVRNYRSDITQFLSSVLDKNHLNSESLRKQLVEKFILSQKEKGLAMATLRRKLVSINQFLEWAIQSTVPVVKPVASLLSSKLPAVKPLTQPAMQPAAGGNAPAQEAYLIPLAIEK